MFIEVGHFYTHESYKKEDLWYLQNEQINPQDRTALFIDDYTFNSCNLNVHKLVADCEEVLQLKGIECIFESEMVPYFDKAVEYLDQSKITVEGNRIKYNGFCIKDHKGPKCIMLSYTWTMYRLGLLDRTVKKGDILTIIDSKYIDLEEKVLRMIPGEYLSKVSYRFFKK